MTFYSVVAYRHQQQRAIDFSPWGRELETRIFYLLPFLRLQRAHMQNSHMFALTNILQKQTKWKKNSRALLSPPAVSFIFANFSFLRPTSTPTLET